MTPDDFKTPTWARLRALLHERLQQAREMNDSGDMDSTLRRRGQIAEIKELLALEPQRQTPRTASAQDAADSFLS